MENPYAERIIRSIKEEEAYLADYFNFADAYHSLKERKFKLFSGRLGGK